MQKKASAQYDAMVNRLEARLQSLNDLGYCEVLTDGAALEVPAMTPLVAQVRVKQWLDDGRRRRRREAEG